MTAFLGFAAIVLIAMLLFPHTAFGKLCRHQLVERPVAWLCSVERKDVILLLVLIGFGLSMGEAAMLFGPELMAAFALDTALYIDVMLVSYTASLMARLRGMRVAVRMAVRRFVPRPLRKAMARGKRAARTGAAPRRPANDDEPHPALVAA